MYYNLIVACSNNYGIGYKESLPWHISNDLKKFSKLTKGNGNNAIIMGRKTWDSLPIKPLPNRINIILSSNKELKEKYSNNKNILFFSSFEEIDNYCNSNVFDEIYVIGGETLYNYYLSSNKIKSIYLTLINKYFNCDTFINKSFFENNFNIIEKEIEYYQDIEINYLKLQKNN